MNTDKTWFDRFEMGFRIYTAYLHGCQAFIGNMILFAETMQNSMKEVKQIHKEMGFYKGDNLYT